MISFLNAAEKKISLVPDDGYDLFFLGLHFHFTDLIFLSFDFS